MKLSSLYKTESVVALLLPGPNLLQDLNYINEDFKLIGVNHHTTRLFDLDYMVFADKIHLSKDLKDAYYSQPEGTRISSHQDQCDYELDVVWWYGFGSASLAFWISCYLADKVYVCGADLLQSKQRFFYGENNKSYGKGLEWQLEAWKKAPQVAKKLNTEVEVVSGPLSQLFETTP